MYVAKLEEMKAIGDPIALRAEEESNRPGAVALLQASATKFLNMAAGPRPRPPPYSHSNTAPSQHSNTR